MLLGLLMLVWFVRPQRHHAGPAGQRRIRPAETGHKRPKLMSVSTVSRESRPNHHVVSRGLQRNFADDSHRIALLDSTSGRLIDRSRAIKSNFVLPGFNEVELESGTSDWLERAFASIERTVLNQVRTVGPRNAGPKMRAAVANLFALHLVRSESFRTGHDHVMGQLRTDEIPRIANDAEAVAIFQRQYGRSPADGEIQAIAEQLLDRAAAGKRMLAESTALQHDRIAEMLNRFSMQVLWTVEPRPGFILGDVPVVHGLVESERFGFRDGLAIGDANLVIGPLTRRIAVCFTARQLPHVELRTRKMVDLVNAVFWRASRELVACHPDDVLATQQMARRIDRLPVRMLHMG